MRRTVKLFRPSRFLGTMASADFSQFVVTTDRAPSVRPHGISPEPFPVYSPDLRIEVTVAFLDFDALCHLIRSIRLNIRFLSVEPRFRYCFFSPASHDTNLASRYRVRRQLRPSGLSPEVRDMPVIQRRKEGRIAFFCWQRDAFGDGKNGCMHYEGEKHNCIGVHCCIINLSS